MWHLLLYIAAKWWGMLYIRGVLRFLKSTEILIRHNILHERRSSSNFLIRKKVKRSFGYFVSTKRVLQIEKLIFKICKISYLYEHSWFYKINSRLDLPTESTSCFIYCAAQMISTEISFYIELALFDCYYKASSSNLKDIFVIHFKWHKIY